MSKVMDQSSEIQVVQCYICQEDAASSQCMEVPITTGGMVWAHPKCMELYMKSVSQRPAACGSCTGEAGCC